MEKYNVPKNVKIFNDEELKFLNDSYDFEIKSDLILVKSKKIKRTIAHSKKNNFYLNTKLSRITISPLAIQHWEYMFKDCYTLFEVQNAINELFVMYQDATSADIARLLKRKTTKIMIEN